MSSKDTIFISFLGVTVAIKTNWQPYLAFLKDYFLPIITENKSGNCKIMIEVFWEYKKWKNKISDEVSRGFTRFGANTYVAENSSATVFKEKQKIFFKRSFKEGVTHHTIIVRPRFFERAAGGFLQKTKTKESFYQLSVQAIYYPLFYYLHLHRNLIILHASAVEYKKNGIIFCGLDGIGKTSAALCLAKSEEGFLVSDNLVFAGCDKIYSCYEQVRFYKEQVCLINEKKLFKKSGLAKEFYLFPAEKMANDVTGNFIFFIESANINKIVPLGLKQGIRRALDLNRLSGELQRYPSFFALFNLGANVNLNNEEKILYSAFSKARFFQIQVNFSLGLEPNMEFIKKTMDSLI